MGKEVKIRVVNTQYEIIKTVARDLNWELIEDPNRDDWDINWQDFAVSNEQFSSLKSFQKINHFPGMQALSRKNRLAQNLTQMKMLYKEYDFFPDTWVWPRDMVDLRNKSKNMTMIVKPEASCQGKGIFLTQDLDHLPEKCVVQEYIKNPYLIENLKFDLRIYVLVLGCDPLRIFIYEEGLVRFATEEYKEALNNLENSYMHLTNYAINKNNPKFIAAKGNKGHKRSLSWLMDYLDEQGKNIDVLWCNIKDIVIKTLISGQPHLSHIYRSLRPHEISNSMCFELLGFDILLDSCLKPWLLEVNHTPSFKIDTAMDELIKRMAILDTFNLINIQPNDSKRGSLIFQTQTLLKTLKFCDLKKWNRIEEKKSQLLREKFEEQVEGGFQKIFPNNKSDYERFLSGSKTAWLGAYCIKMKTVNHDEEEKKPVARKRVFPNIQSKFLETSTKSYKLEILPPMFAKSFYRPAPKLVNTFQLPQRKKRSSSGFFIKPKTVLYEGEQAQEENKSFMKWKLTSFIM